MIGPFVRLAAGVQAPAGARSRLSVLIFHRVLAARDPLQPDAPTVEEFRDRLAWIKRCFNVIPLREAARGLREGFLPERPLAITFDDGYADNNDLALPVLQSLGLPATFFVATGYLDGGIMFNDVVIESVRQARAKRLDLSGCGLGVYEVGSDQERRSVIRSLLPRLKPLAPAIRDEVASRIAEAAGATIPRDLMMTSEQVASLSKAGMDVGGHTVSHPILTSLPAQDALREIRDGRDALERIIAAKVALFAYPNGRPGEDYGPQHVAMAKELGFDAAVSTARGVARSGADLHQIPRFTPWDAAPWRFGLRLALNLGHVKYPVV